MAEGPTSQPVAHVSFATEADASAAVQVLREVYKFRVASKNPIRASVHKPSADESDAAAAGPEPPTREKMRIMDKADRLKRAERVSRPGPTMKGAMYTSPLDAEPLCEDFRNGECGRGVTCLYGRRYQSSRCTLPLRLRAHFTGYGGMNNIFEWVRRSKRLEITLLHHPRACEAQARI